MATKSEQQRLNEEIAYELDKYQVMLEYGRMYLDDESKARKNLKLPMFRQFKGIIELTLNPSDGVVKQTGVHLSHYTWWMTKSFQMSNLTMLQL